MAFATVATVLYAAVRQRGGAALSELVMGTGTWGMFVPPECGAIEGVVWTTFWSISVICPKIACLSIQVREDLNQFLGIIRKSI